MVFVLRNFLLDEILGFTVEKMAQSAKRDLVARARAKVDFGTRRAKSPSCPVVVTSEDPFDDNAG